MACVDMLYYSHAVACRGERGGGAVAPGADQMGTTKFTQRPLCSAIFSNLVPGAHHTVHIIKVGCSFK